MGFTASTAEARCGGYYRGTNCGYYGGYTEVSYGYDYFPSSYGAPSWYDNAYYPSYTLDYYGGYYDPGYVTSYYAIPTYTHSVCERGCYGHSTYYGTQYYNPHAFLPARW